MSDPFLMVKSWGVGGSETCRRLCGDVQAAMWWWPMRLYCQHWDCFDSRFSIPSPKSQSQSLDNFNLNIFLLMILRNYEPFMFKALYRWPELLLQQLLWPDVSWYHNFLCWYTYLNMDTDFLLTWCLYWVLVSTWAMFLIMRLRRLSGGFIPGEVRERRTHYQDSAARDNKYVRIKELWHLILYDSFGLMMHILLKQIQILCA